MELRPSRETFSAFLDRSPYRYGLPIRSIAFIPGVGSVARLPAAASLRCGQSRWSRPQRRASAGVTTKCAMDACGGKK
jgi:hypothetical protein